MESELNSHIYADTTYDQIDVDLRQAQAFTVLEAEVARLQKVVDTLQVALAMHDIKVDDDGNLTVQNLTVKGTLHSCEHVHATSADFK